MLANEQELQTTQERIAWFQQQVAHLRRTEANPVNYRAAVSGFLAEIDCMQLDVREYFSSLPPERKEAGESGVAADGGRNAGLIGASGSVRDRHG